MEREILSAKKSEALYKLIKTYKNEDKVRTGTNETIKAVKNGTAVLVVLADNSVPLCLTNAIVDLCEQQGIRFVYVEQKELLGKACLLTTNAISLAIVEDKENDSSQMLKALSVV
ncbi:RL7A [Enterospora canceri]|uniref:RL7A n=1 Tax=Enterospora canceri TaxID=1081671 RepID=A0A1Y1S8C5_9MICR|nr:RL7A [Enterospora canceri]